MSNLFSLDQVQFDILVAGGGPAGSAAAITAARAGAKVLLVEKNGFLGGNLTAAGIDTIYGLYTIGEKIEKIIGGISDEIIDRLKLLNACYERRNTYGAGTGLTFDVESMKLVLEQMVIESGCTLLFHSIIPEPIFKGENINGAVLSLKSGIHHVEANVVIDTSGDADLIAKAGGAFEKALDTGQVQSCTTVFFMAGVDIQMAKAFGKKAIWEAMRAANQTGKYHLPREEGSFHATPNPNMIEANMTRIVNVDTTDIQSITAAELEGRRQVQQYTRFLIECIPGFEKAYLVKTGCQLGMREGRRIIGDYILTKDDVLEGRKFSDSITRCGQPIEDHHTGADTNWIYVKENGYYDIPYRCLIPKGLNNTLTAGRSLAATHDAHASARSSGTAFSMGQAAGLGAVLALEQKNRVRDIDLTILRQNLMKIGAII